MSGGALDELERDEEISHLCRTDAVPRLLSRGNII
jgi:hypothetical protein